MQQARAIILADVQVVPAEKILLHQALGRVLAESVAAVRDQSPFAASSMDGYALHSADTPGVLQMIGESAAGRNFAGVCGKGMAVRISTGAPLPGGADAVVIQEDVTRDGERLTVPVARPGDNIRRQGMDFTAGAVLLADAQRLDGIAIALAAAAGKAELSVRRIPRIAILCSGDELVAPGETPGQFQVYDSAAHGVAALILSWGGSALRLPLASDSAQAIARAAEEGLRDHDLLVVIGGASVGDHDHARPALQALGLQMQVDKIALRPGKPTWFGRTPLGPVLGLPGNPASALVCAHLFIRPLLGAMLGRAPMPVFRRARLAQSLPANGPREHYLRSRLATDNEGRLIVQAFEQQDSSLLSVFAAANALIRLLPNQSAVEAGALVDLMPLDAFGC